MTDQELIQKIQLLKHVKPSKNWVVSVKKEILGRETTVLEKMSWIEIFRVFNRASAMKPVFVTALSVFVIIGIFGFTQSSLPGNLLYPLKQLSEKGRVFFASEDEKPLMQLEFASQRVSELVKVATKPGPKNNNLFAAFRVVNQDLSIASEHLENAKAEDKEVLANKTEELIKKTQDAVVQFIESQIRALENQTLNEEQLELLAGAKKDIEMNNLDQALIKIYQASNR